MNARHKRLTAARGLLADNPVLAVIAGIGFFVSFQTIADLAQAQNMPGWPILYPLLADALFLGFMIEARRAIDDGCSDLVPRLLAWAVGVFTVYINIHGSPAGDWLGITLHAAAPCAWIAFLELTRWRRLRRKRAETQAAIPLARWLAEPPHRVIGMRRRMIVNNVTSYPVACAREEARLVGIDVARAALGRRWKRDAPTVLRRHLTAGTLPQNIAEVCATASPGHAPPVAEVVDEWVCDALTRPSKTAAKVRQEKQQIEAETLPEDTSAAASRNRPRKSAEHTSQHAPRKPSRAQVKKMSPAQLVPYVGTLLETNPDLSQKNVMDDLHCGIDKAREALRLAKQERVLVPFAGQPHAVGK